MCSLFLCLTHTLFQHTDSEQADPLTLYYRPWSAAGDPKGLPPLDREGEGEGEGEGEDSAAEEEEEEEEEEDVETDA
jgi:hypothetical protein